MKPHERPASGAPRRRDAVDVAFRVGIALKAVYAVGEFVAGVAMSFLDPTRMQRLIH